MRARPIHERPSISAALGVACGFAVGPLFALTSFLRGSRTFHPHGDLYAARVSVEATSRTHAELAARLAGPAIVRFSGALWKHAQILDVLGCALRFRGDETITELSTDQDLLFATIQRPWTMPIAPLMTNARDYLGNDYFAVSPFDVVGIGRLYFRLRPDQVSKVTGGRGQRLDVAVARACARLHLEGARGPWGPWQPIASVDILSRIDTDDAALRFDPFADGRGLRPVGFVHSLRRGVYEMSQLARPKRER